MYYFPLILPKKIMDQEIFQILISIQRDISDIKREISGLKRSDNKISEHIDFVEGIYDTIVTPVNRIFETIGNGRLLERK